jgi:hypothetical protein
VSKHLLFSITFLLLAITASGQEYLDSDKRFMKLAEVSVDGTYGFIAENPIKVGAEEKAIGAYLNSLKLSDGDHLHIADINFNSAAPLTMVVLSYEQKKDLTTLYFLTSAYSAPRAPLGFGFKTIDDIPKVVRFSPDLIKSVTPCSKTLFAVDDLLLEETLGAEPGKPKSNPAFKGGPEKLRNYFAAHPLTDETAKQMLFRVSIAFVVTCDNKAGNFQIITKGKGDLETYANQVLAVVNDMPQDWQAATVKGKPVDCYQVLSFTVAGGQLDRVSYR